MLIDTYHRLLDKDKKVVVTMSLLGGGFSDAQKIDKTFRCLYRVYKLRPKTVSRDFFQLQIFQLIRMCQLWRKFHTELYHRRCKWFRLRR